MTQITPLPKPPSTKDSANFDVRADAFLEALPPFGEELNKFGAEFEVTINNASEKIEEQLKDGINKGKEILQECAEAHRKKLEAIAAVKSDSWQNIAQFILIMLRGIREARANMVRESGRLLEYKLFFRESLPKGYVRAGSILKISDYPLAWYYARKTSSEAQENIPYTHFKLPKGNLYVKGTSNGDIAGSYGEQQLLEHSHEYSITNLHNTWDRIKGGTDDSRNYSGHLSHSSVATSAVGAKTNEVNRIHLLEGYYVGG